MLWWAQKLHGTLGFSHRLLTCAMTERCSVVRPPVLEACWVYSRPQTAHAHHLPAYHASHRGRREPAGLAPNLCETRFYARECFDGPARPGCRLCPVRAVIRTCPVLENSSCQMTRDLHLTCQHRPPGSLPKTHATEPPRRCRNPEHGHCPPCPPQLCVMTVAWRITLTYQQGLLILASALARECPGATLIKTRVKERHAIRNPWLCQKYRRNAEFLNF